jgi:site-specific DNA recombinase
MGRVARLLNERKLLSKAQRARNGCEVPRWTKGAVGRLLRNPVYAGLLQSGKELFEGEQQALVERAAWERVQRMLEGHERAPGVRSLNPAYVLRGVLRCGMCGAAMTPASSRRGKREYRYYRCTKRDKGGKEDCPAKPMPAPVIEEYVVGRLVEATADGPWWKGRGARWRATSRRDGID